MYAAPKVDMLIHYLYRDEPDLARWQSGLETVRRRGEAGAEARRCSRSRRCRGAGRRTTVWGQVRPGSGPQRYVLQRRVGGALDRGRRRRTTNRDAGLLQARVDAPKGSQLRVWYPARRLASATLVVR